MAIKASHNKDQFGIIIQVLDLDKDEPIINEF